MSHRGIFNKTHLLSFLAIRGPEPGAQVLEPLHLTPALRAPTGRPTVTSLHPPRLCRIAVFSIKPTFLSLSGEQMAARGGGCLARVFSAGGGLVLRGGLHACLGVEGFRVRLRVRGPQYYTQWLAHEHGPKSQAVDSCKVAMRAGFYCHVPRARKHWMQRPWSERPRRWLRNQSRRRWPFETQASGP